MKVINKRTRLVYEVAATSSEQNPDYIQFLIYNYNRRTWEWVNANDFEPHFN